MSKYLELAELCDDNLILQDSYALWSGGLKPDDHRQFRLIQKQHPWGRRHLRYFVWRESGKDRSVLSSCKLYDFEFKYRSQTYRVAGIGAVFTSKHRRGQGHASNMIMAVCDLAREEGYDALMLNSDIDWRYYAQFGFVPFEAVSFVLELEANFLEASLSRLNWLMEDNSYPVRMEPLSLDHVPYLARHYKRWQKNKVLSLSRSDSYWSFKIMKELFLQEKAQPPTAGIQVLSTQLEELNGAYALFEYGTQALRVLEVVGSPANTLLLWRELINTAKSRKFAWIRGWEGAACAALGFRKYERNWSRPMLLPCTPQTRNWIDIEPWPLLELDHY